MGKVRARCTSLNVWMCDWGLNGRTVVLKTGRSTRHDSRCTGTQDRLATVRGVIERSVGRHLSCYAADCLLEHVKILFRKKLRAD